MKRLLAKPDSQEVAEQRKALLEKKFPEQEFEITPTDGKRVELNLLNAKLGTKLRESDIEQMKRYAQGILHETVEGPKDEEPGHGE